MDKPTLRNIAKALTKSDFVVFTNPFSINLGGIRTKDNGSNAFNDYLFAFYYDMEGVIHGEVIPGTTDAGLFYRNNPINPKGTVILQHDVQHRGVYQYQDPSRNGQQRGHRGRLALRQIKPMKYWRDSNRDNYLDFGPEEEFSNSLTNVHYMGKFGKVVGKWSAGCQGSSEKELNKLFNVCHKQIMAGLGDVFSYTLLHEDTFKKLLL